MSSIEWMGRYRHLVGALVQHSNTFSHSGSKMELRPGCSLSSQEWQTLEYLIEFENADLNMAAISRGLGLATSSLSKYLNTLCKMKLVERYRLAGNRKSIIPKPTALGHEVYRAGVENIIGRNFQEFFADLYVLTDEQLEQVACALERFNLRMRRHEEPELIPVKEEE